MSECDRSDFVIAKEVEQLKKVGVKARHKLTTIIFKGKSVTFGIRTELKLKVPTLEGPRFDSRGDSEVMSDQSNLKNPSILYAKTV